MKAQSNPRTRLLPILAAIGTLCAAGSLPVQASSHREAPAITGMPKVDATDLYMFRSYESGRADYVTLIANYVPLQDAYGGPNYFKMTRKRLRVTSKKSATPRTHNSVRSRTLEGQGPCRSTAKRSRPAAQCGK